MLLYSEQNYDGVHNLQEFTLRGWLSLLDTSQIFFFFTVSMYLSVQLGWGESLNQENNHDLHF